ncbi:MAG TPA: hypothetical protein VG347_15620 [Verrucomicrobiae bacterium]|nr:hypothetical protein [Verrucomicrobiae bacterium]
MINPKYTHKTILALTASILAAGGAQAYELNLGTNMPPVDFHGFASQGFLDSTGYNYLADNSKRGSFKFSEAAVNASMNPFPRTHIAVQGFLFDVGNVGEYYPALDYASVDYTFCDQFGIRAGRIRRPEGIYNSIQDIDLARTSVLLPQGMYDARWRDFTGSIDGGSIFGNFDLRKAGNISYEIYGGQVNISGDGGIARLLQDSLRNAPTQYLGVNGFPEVGMQVWYNTPVDGLRAGFAIYDALGFSYDYNVNVPPQFGGGSNHSVIEAMEEHYSLEYVVKSWTFQAEYKYSAYQNHDEVNGVIGPTTHTGTDVWYVGASYRFNKWFEAGTYYTEDYANVDDRDGGSTTPKSDAYQKDLALSLRFDPKPWWVLKVEGHYIQGTALLADNAHNPVRNNNGWFMLAVKSTFSF